MEASALARRAPLDTPGHVSPMRAVPGIERPEYMFRTPSVSRSQVRAPRPSPDSAEARSRIAAGARLVHHYRMPIAHDAYPSCLGYMGFPKSICTSINEVICHSIPTIHSRTATSSYRHHRALQDGVRGDTMRAVFSRQSRRGVTPAHRTHERTR